MVQNMTKRTQVIIGAALVVVAALVGTILLMQVFSPKEQDPFKESNTSQKDTPSEPTKPSKPEDTKEQPTENGGALVPSETDIDPATLGTVDIPGLDVTVSYIKGIGGFEYEVLRTPSGTQYVEFRSPSLAGTKCTDDKGAFASILAEPKTAETATLAKSITKDGTLYGLSLPTASCTNDAESLAAYQKSFSDAFLLIKKTN